MLKKGRIRLNESDFRHASGCPRDVWGVFDTWAKVWCPRRGSMAEMQAHAAKINGQIRVNRGPALERYVATELPPNSDQKQER
jgi:hypothetical protein